MKETRVANITIPTVKFNIEFRYTSSVRHSDITWVNKDKGVFNYRYLLITTPTKQSFKSALSIQQKKKGSIRGNITIAGICKDKTLWEGAVRKLFLDSRVQGWSYKELKI